MNIKTAVHLAIGIGIGFFIFGKDEDQEKVIHFVKSKLKWLLYADDGKRNFKPNATVKYNGAMGPITYTRMTKKERNFKSGDPYWETFLQFESLEKAMYFLDLIEKRLKNYGYLTVKQLVENMHNETCDYAFSKYGWIKSELDDDNLQVLYAPNQPEYKRYTIPLGNPTYLEPADASDNKEGEEDAE